MDDEFKKTLKATIEIVNRENHCTECEFVFDPENIQWAANDYLYKRYKEKGWLNE